MPSRVVVDSSVAIKWFLPEPNSDAALRLLDAFLRGDLEFLAPDLIHAEVGNILWKKVRLQGFDETDARRVLGEFRSLAFAMTPIPDLLEDAFDLAVTHGRTVYDCLYLALADRAGCQFVTADERFANAVAATRSNVVFLPDWP